MSTNNGLPANTVSHTQINDGNRRRATLLAFALVPLSGLATDVYIPSFPGMASAFHTNSAGIQYTIICFLLSYGISQLFVGSIVDSFGRYRINLAALLVFALSNAVIIFTTNIHLVYVMRVLQGTATAFIIVGKRAFFVDVYTGEKQRHYTSMLSIIWATAPILAPFFGGYIQKSFGWQYNFVVLGVYGMVMFLLEFFLSGESIKIKQPFHLRSIFKVYRNLVSSVDFSLGIVILGICFAMVLIFTMSAPFIVEHKFHLSSVTTGYCALLSGLSLFVGGIAGKTIKSGNLFKRLMWANLCQLVVITLMYIFAAEKNGLLLLLLFVIPTTVIGGCIYNIFFTYCLTRFPLNAGVASGLTSGGAYLVTSVMVSGLLSFITITDQSSLAIGYIVLGLMITGLLVLIRKKLAY
ncbi:multidrug effflux MFS transporter [Mucilaginibacter sp. 14171R-50]|uniref:MFS transporter n=1 Tax=Mucilaginibacter sp. 14171R-50 TaxID=2703789 RepID=UPI00138D5A29|nr:MFS transporter [Mucilaginibacter sp. 14171R-50]QHS57052.1 multidrug effflux MFS transporter [Mucilaginibacter sp. 14171R-50]